MAEQVIQGIVTEVSVRDWSDNETGSTIQLYSFKVDSDNRWFRTGTNNPASKGVAQGAGVRFTANGQKVDINSIEGAQVAASAPPPPKSKGRGGYNKGGGGGGGSRNDYWEKKGERDVKVVEPRITLSSAQRDAISVIDMALRSDSIVFGNANKGARLDIIMEAIDKVAMKFYDDRMAFGEGE